MKILPILPTDALMIMWAITWVVFHVAAKPLTIDFDFVGCMAFSILMASVVNKLKAE